MRMQHFQRGVALEIDILAQVDIGGPTTAQQTKHAIVAELLPHTVGHRTLLEMARITPRCVLPLESLETGSPERRWIERAPPRAFPPGDKMTEVIPNDFQGCRCASLRM